MSGPGLLSCILLLTLLVSSMGTKDSITDAESRQIAEHHGHLTEGPSGDAVKANDKNM